MNKLFEFLARADLEWMFDIVLPVAVTLTVVLACAAILVTL